MKKLYAFILICWIAAVAPAVVIDDFEDGDMDEYVQTVVLDNAGYPPQIVWSASGGSVWATIETYDDIEQSVALRDDYSLGIGDILKIDTTGHVDGSQDIGLVVAATKTPTYNQRQDYVNVYMRTATEVYTRGFNGTTEFSLISGDAPSAVDALFIQRIAANQFSTGYTIGSVKTVLVTRTVANATIGNAIGLYTDMRSANTHGGLDNLEILSPAVITSHPNDLFLPQTQSAVFTTIFTSESSPTVTWYKAASPADIIMDAADVQTTYDAQAEQYTSTLTLTNVMPADSGQYDCQIINDAGYPVNSQTADLRVVGLVAHWTLDQGRYAGGNYLEEVSGYDAAVTGTPTFVSGVDGTANGAAQVSASDGWALCPTFNPVRQSGQMTVSFWANWSETQVTQQDLIVQSPNETLSLTNGLKADGQWQHICTVFDGTAGKLYVDGVLQDQTLWQIPSASDAAINIGCGSGGENAFNGALDEMRIYNYALSDTEVAALYDAVAGGCPPGFDSTYDFTGPEGTPDCVVDIFDLAEFADYYLTGDTAGDLTGPAGTPDGTVNLYELADLAAAWLTGDVYPDN